jgi:hypothetical protein
MATKKFCDLCNKEFKDFDRTFFFSYGEKTKFLMSSNTKKGEICENCIKVINEAISDLKRK